MTESPQMGSAPASTWIRAARWLGLAAVLGLYLQRLDTAPPNLHFDEVLFGLQAHSIATTGYDLNARWFPLYFQMDPAVWFHPLGVYLAAFSFSIFPVSIDALRAPSALLGVLDIVLIYFVSLRLHRREAWAWLAAVLLALAPAHFLHSRVAMDFLFPVPFVLGWLLALLNFLERRTPAMLFLAASILGVGVYSYIAALVMMPVYLAITCAVLWGERAPARWFAVVAAGFAWPLLFLVWFAAGHPDAVLSTLGRYGIDGGGASLNALQRLREALTPWAISDWLNSYFRAFSPGYLFVSGGASLISSTRAAGVFLWPCAIFLAAGLLRGAGGPSIRLILVVGFLTAPLAASTVGEDFAIARSLELLPFVVLLMVDGIRYGWTIEIKRTWRPIHVAAGLVGVTVGAGYAAYRLSRGEPLGASAMLLVGAGLALLAVGAAVDRTKRGWPVILLLLILTVAQFQAFHRDYFGDYRNRSAAWFGGDMRSATLRLAELAGAAGHIPVLLSAGIPRADWYWRFYLAASGREHLNSLAVLAEPHAISDSPWPPGTLLLVSVEDTDARLRATRSGFIEVERITALRGYNEGEGDTLPPLFLIYRRN